MAGKSVSGYVDEGVAERLAAMASAEARTPASLVGQAISFYTTLPEVARVALRRIEHKARPEERRWVESEVVRLLMRADFQVTQRMMADELRGNLPSGSTETELEEAALEWTASTRP